MRGGLGGGFSLTEPTLAFASATDPDSDNTQDFNATVFEDIEGYYVRLVGSYGATTVSEPYDIDQFNLIDGSEAVLLLATFLTGAIPNGDVAFKCRIQSGAGDGTGTAASDWSNTVTKEIDQPAPTLTSPVDEAVTPTTSSGGVTTDISGGTLYAVVTVSATPPSAAQIKAGQDNSGAAATATASQAVTTTGAQTITGGFTGETPSTAYGGTYFVQETINGFSNVAAADGFTTPASTTTFNPSDKDASIALSGGDLVATGSAANKSVRAIRSQSTGKFYFEVVPNNNAGFSFGISNASHSLGTWVGANVNSVGYSGNQVYNNGSLGAVYTFAASDVIQVAIDIDNKLIWVRKNTSNWNNNGSANPATGAGGITFTASGPFFPTVSVDNTRVATANFGATAYAQTPPSGFSNW